jgi:hypothetical protein
MLSSVMRCTLCGQPFNLRTVEKALLARVNFPATSVAWRILSHFGKSLPQPGVLSSTDRHAASCLRLTSSVFSRTSHHL